MDLNRAEVSLVGHHGPVSAFVPKPNSLIDQLPQDYDPILEKLVGAARLTRVPVTNSKKKKKKKIIKNPAQESNSEPRKRA